MSVLGGEFLRRRPKGAPLALMRGTTLHSGSVGMAETSNALRFSRVRRLAVPRQGVKLMKFGKWLGGSLKGKGFRQVVKHCLSLLVFFLHFCWNSTKNLGGPALALPGPRSSRRLEDIIYCVMPAPGMLADRDVLQERWKAKKTWEKLPWERGGSGFGEMVWGFQDVSRFFKWSVFSKLFGFRSFTGVSQAFIGPVLAG